MSDEMRKDEENTGEIEKDFSKLKKAKAKLWISFGILTLVFAVIGVALAIFIHYYAAIFFSGICEIMLLIVWLPKQFKRVKRCFCSECGAKYDYQEDVSWEVSDIEIKEKSTNPNSKSRQVAAVRIEYVDFECSCEKCGSVSTFTHKFQTGVEYDDGREKVKNVALLIKDYFKV